MEEYFVFDYIFTFFLKHPNAQLGLAKLFPFPIVIACQRHKTDLRILHIVVKCYHVNDPPLPIIQTRPP